MTKKKLSVGEVQIEADKYAREQLSKIVFHRDTDRIDRAMTELMEHVRQGLAAAWSAGYITGFHNR